MTAPTLDPEFASAVRAELVATGTKKSRIQRHQRRARILAVGIGAIAVAGVTTGAAVIANLPGLTTVTPTGTAVTITNTGTATIDLGPSVNGANSVVLDVTCVSGTGKVSVPTIPGVTQNIKTGKVLSPAGTETSELDCGTPAGTMHITDGLLEPGGTTITITADPDTTWKATAQYGTATTTDWGVNANGQTYGADNKKNGMPDLQSARATNGAVGYIYTKDLFGPEASHDGGSINVYESDGTTVIGEFVFHGDPGTHTSDE